MRYLTRPPAPTPSMQVAEVTRDENLEPPYEYKPFITEPLMLEDGGRVGFQSGKIATRKPHGSIVDEIADAFLKAYAEDDVSYLTAKTEFHKKGMLGDFSFAKRLKNPNFIQTMVDKTGLKAGDILDLIDERDSYVKLELMERIGSTPKPQTEKIIKQIDQGEDWLIENSKNYDTVKDLKKGFKRALDKDKDHPFLRKSLKTSYGLPKLNPLFFENKKSTFAFDKKAPRFDYNSTELEKLFQASLYNFNPAIRDKVLNELDKILPKTKITETQKYDIRKKFENSKILSEFGINKSLTGPVTRLLIKDLGENIIENINFIKYPRVQVVNYIRFLKDKVDPKYREQFELVGKAINQLYSKNYNGLKETLKIVENINLDHKIPRFLIDAGYADEIEYIKLNPIGEKFNMGVKNISFDQPMSRLIRKYEATNVPEEKTKIVQKMNELKDSFNKRYNNYLSGIDIKEIDGKLNMSSSFEPITSADEFVKVLETNVKQNPELFKIRDKVENVITKSAMNIADELSKEDVRAVCGKLNSGGLPKGCAELAKENPERFIKTVAETTKDASLATKATQAFNVTKKIASVADEVLLLGKGVAGRTLAPLAVLNSALDQLTAGNYREAYRQVFDFLDPSSLVGDPFGFEKSRREGSIENIRSKIGKENQDSFNKLLEFKDNYNKLVDVKKKLEAAENVTQDPNASFYDPDFINNLKKEEINLTNILNSPKYENIKNDYSNVGKAALKEIFSRNVGAPEQNKITYETALEEILTRILGSNLFQQFNDVNKELFKNKTFIEAIRKKESETLPENLYEDFSKYGGDVGPIVAPSKEDVFKNLSNQDLQSLADVMPKEFVTQAAVEYAKGGRVNFNEGGSGRRGFLKFLIGLGVSSGLLKGLKIGDTAKDVIKITKPIKLANQFENAPSWFGDLLSVIAKPENITDDLKQIDGSPALGKTYSSQGVKIVEDDKTIDVMFETDNGMRGYIVYTKPSEVVDPKTKKIQKIPGEYQEYELIYRGDGENYTKDWEEGIVSGKSNLIETSGNKASKEELAQASRFADEQSAAEARMEADLDFLESQKDEID